MTELTPLVAELLEPELTIAMSCPSAASLKSPVRSETAFRVPAGGAVKALALQPSHSHQHTVGTVGDSGLRSWTAQPHNTGTRAPH